MTDRDSRHEIDEAALVVRVLAGDIDAFEGIVVRWQGPLVNLAHRYCRDAGKAEDLAQEVFLKLFRNLSRWRRDSKFSTWMFAIAHNHYRSEFRRHVPPGVDLEKVPIAAGDRRIEVDAAGRDEAVRAAVSTLPARYRDVVLLYYFQECDLAETARIARLRPGTVKARLFRARKLLERKLSGWFAPERLDEEISNGRA